MNLPEFRFLKASSAAYEALTRAASRLYREKRFEECLRLIQSTADFAEKRHPGRYADGNLENLAFAIGEQLQPAAGPGLPPAASGASAKRHVLHVATTVYAVGGHTRLIRRWVEADPHSIHSLVITDQGDQQVPRSLETAARASGGSIVVFPEEPSLLTKAAWLRAAAQQGIGAVILHTHPQSVLGTVAFAVPLPCPVALMNHADHIFSLGSPVSDLHIEFKRFGLESSKRRRFAKHTLLLPLRVESVPAGLSREKARAQLGIPQDAVVMLSIGAGYKYTPDERYDFFKTVRKILDTHPKARMYLIGLRPDKNLSFLQPAEHERFHILGVVEDPSVYQAAADLYLDSLPISSCTALLEACVFGACPVPIYAPSPQFDSCGDIPGLDGLEHPPDEEDYRRRVSALIENKAARDEVAARVRGQVLECSFGEGWKKSLEAVFQYLEKTVHRPARIPPAPRTAEPLDLALSALHTANRNRAPRLLNYAFQYYRALAWRDLFRMFVCSARLGEAEGRPIFFLQCWRQVVKRKLAG